MLYVYMRISSWNWDRCSKRRNKVIFNKKCKDENLNDSLFSSYNVGCQNTVEQSSSPFISLGIPSLSCSTASPYWPQGNSCSMGLRRWLWSTLPQQVWLVCFPCGSSFLPRTVARADGPQECCLVSMPAFLSPNMLAQFWVSMSLHFVLACTKIFSFPVLFEYLLHLCKCISLMGLGCFCFPVMVALPWKCSGNL